MNNGLVEYSPQAIANIQTVEEAKDGYEKLKALVSYFRDDYDQAFSLSVATCEYFCRMGELIEVMKENGELDKGQGGDRKSRLSNLTVKLSDIGISKKESSQSQRAGLVPEEQRQEYILRSKLGGCWGLHSELYRIG